jgi:hypothetical protein
MSVPILKEFNEVFKNDQACNKHGCRKRISIFKNSFFDHSKMKCNEVFRFGYLWLSGCNHKTIIRMTGHSSLTVIAYIGYYRQLVSSSLDDEDQVIGGPGIIVEVDESKFGKRKYNRGHRVDGVWVFGGVERKGKDSRETSIC